MTDDGKDGSVNNGRMSKEEFKAWLQSADTDGHGGVSTQELQEALRCLGLRFSWWKARRAMAHADVNQNQHIGGDFDFELDQLVKYAQARWGIIVE